jgi:4a-hydroxytetrahydrobiopterin dehydratase
MVRLAEETISEKLSGLAGWGRTGEAIAKTYTFDTFLGGIDFINGVAEIAEEADHHPDIAVHYRKVTFTLWTHSEGGLTERDFDLAQKIEKAFQDRSM